ncbi:hypothetical protein [Psychromonas hadalis]|uniref:hypothetical protein n=1 Tax=Psychromonas hadalis TaxID=211669 RepID=UPI0003B5FA62|nr:hypothetical protein [Psychromonas hadalis]
MVRPIIFFVKKLLLQTTGKKGGSIKAEMEVTLLIYRYSEKHNGETKISLPNKK